MVGPWRWTWILSGKLSCLKKTQTIRAAGNKQGPATVPRRGSQGHLTCWAARRLCSALQLPSIHQLPLLLGVLPFDFCSCKSNPRKTSLVHQGGPSYFVLLLAPYLERDDMSPYFSRHSASHTAPLADQRPRTYLELPLMPRLTVNSAPNM